MVYHFEVMFPIAILLVITLLIMSIIRKGWCCVVKQKSHLKIFLAEQETNCCNTNNDTRLQDKTNRDDKPPYCSDVDGFDAINVYGKSFLCLNLMCFFYPRNSRDRFMYCIEDTHNLNRNNKKMHKFDASSDAITSFENSITGSMSVEPQTLPMKNENTCTICLNFLFQDISKTLTYREQSLKVLTLCCGHSFHKSRILSWLKINNRCPICVRIVKMGKLV